MSVASGPFCGAFGCPNEAVARINHPEHGERVVCEDHADAGEVIADV